MTKTHTVPNSISVHIVLTDGHRAVHCAVVRRDGQALAYYPTEWTVNRRFAGAPTWNASGRIPTMSEVMRDARWH